MKVGDLVRYRGWLVAREPRDGGPVAIVTDQRSSDSDFHHRIRVMWLGEEIPIQAQAVSVEGARVSSWVHPKHFEVIDHDV